MPIRLQAAETLKKKEKPNLNKKNLQKSEGDLGNERIPFPKRYITKCFLKKPTPQKKSIQHTLCGEQMSKQDF